MSADEAMREEVALEGAVKAQLLDLEAKLETLDHFALLGIPPGADAATAKTAFFALARTLHPDRYFRKNLGSFKARLEKVFKALSRAHQTLTHPVKREAYLTAHPTLRAPVPVPVPAPPEVAPRRAPMKRMTWQKKDLVIPPVDPNSKSQK